MVREHTEKVKPPRAVFVPFPFGNALGRPNDAALQHRVLRAALDLLAEPAGPVLRDFPDDAEPGSEPPVPVQASVIPETAAGQLLRRVRDRLDASSDPAWKAAAFGVAR